MIDFEKVKAEVNRNLTAFHNWLNRQEFVSSQVVVNAINERSGEGFLLSVVAGKLQVTDIVGKVIPWEKIMLLDATRIIASLPSLVAAMQQDREQLEEYLRRNLEKFQEFGDKNGIWPTEVSAF